jgi:ribonuclease Z
VARVPGAERSAARSAAPRDARDEPSFSVRAAFLDHSTPCLAFAFEEKAHVNVWKNRLSELGVPVGPWLKELKRAVSDGLPEDTTVRARWRDREGEHERTFALGELKARALQIVPGEKLCYVTDVVYHQENQARIARLAAGAELLFIECVFLEEDAEHAARKFHLTAHWLHQRRRARKRWCRSTSPRYTEYG